MQLLTPSIIEKAANDITGFWETSELHDADKKKILEMTCNFYENKDEHIIDQYLAGLARRTINKYSPETGFELNGTTSSTN